MLKFGASTLRRDSMDYKKNDPTFDFEKRIYFSQTVKAGKRIYYLDVKKNKRGELFLSITESKKVYVREGETEEGQFNFEKHKIFLYKEDFGKFIDALSNAIRYIHENGELSSFPFDEMYADDTPAYLADENQAASGNESAESEQPLSDEPTGDIVDKIDLKIDF